MNNKASNQVNRSSLNNSSVQERYARMYYWTQEEATALSLGVDPKKVSTSIQKLKHFDPDDLINTGKFNNEYLRSHTLKNIVNIFNNIINARLAQIIIIKGINGRVYINNNCVKQVNSRTEIYSPEYHKKYEYLLRVCSTFMDEYNQRRNLLKQAIEYKKIPAIYDNDSFKIMPLDFINFCENKNISLPKKLEELVKKYTTKCTDWKAKYKESHTEIEKLKAEIGLIQKENSVPNGKRLTSWQKGFTAALAKIYGKDKLIQSFNTSTKVNSNDSSITYNNISQELSAASGLKLNNETVKELILESVHHLNEKNR